MGKLAKAQKNYTFMQFPVRRLASFHVQTKAPSNGDPPSPCDFDPFFSPNFSSRSSFPLQAVSPIATPLTPPPDVSRPLHKGPFFVPFPFDPSKDIVAYLLAFPLFFLTRFFCRRFPFLFDAPLLSGFPVQKPFWSTLFFLQQLDHPCFQIFWSFCGFFFCYRPFPPFSEFDDKLVNFLNYLCSRLPCPPGAGVGKGILFFCELVQ